MAGAWLINLRFYFLHPNSSHWVWLFIWYLYTFLFGGLGVFFLFLPMKFENAVRHWCHLLTNGWILKLSFDKWLNFKISSPLICMHVPQKLNRSCKGISSICIGLVRKVYWMFCVHTQKQKTCKQKSDEFVIYFEIMGLF